LIDWDLTGLSAQSIAFKTYMLQLKIWN